MNLYFNLQSIPRSTTRKEWEELWRWKRQRSKELDVIREEKIKLIRRKDCPVHIRRSIIESLMNPPLLMGTPL